MLAYTGISWPQDVLSKWSGVQGVYLQLVKLQPIVMRRLLKRSWVINKEGNNEKGHLLPLGEQRHCSSVCGLFAALQHDFQLYRLAGLPICADLSH